LFKQRSITNVTSLAPSFVHKQQSLPDFSRHWTTSPDRPRLQVRWTRCGADAHRGDLEVFDVPMTDEEPSLLGGSDNVSEAVDAERGVR
jgi:hypothetical protein